MFDFETWVDRCGHDSMSADRLKNDLWQLPVGNPKPGFDPIPLWLADMNFATAPCVIEVIKKRLDHPIFGYFAPSAKYYEAIKKWQKDSFGVTDLLEQNIGYQNGVLGGVTSALSVLTDRGGAVLVHSPIYSGFLTQLKRNGYEIVLSDLVVDEAGVWRMDFVDMERKIQQYKIHTLLFCSPHNPTGRVWSREELERLSDLCEKYDIYVICDEIWADFTLFGNRHIPLQTVSPALRERTMAFYSPSKTFNLAGIVGAYHIVYNQRLLDRLSWQSCTSHYNDMNVLTMHALIGAYSEQGRIWLDELKKVLEENITYATSFIHQNFEGVRLVKLQGTFMMLLECSQWCQKHGVAIEEVLLRGVEAGVIWRDGKAFNVPCGIRMNVGIPFAKIKEVCDRLLKYVFI
ncbi:MalY/PatB family protein [Turicimonas muris]|uniref:MalY/PatB family protein n=1 Tax=Turicimonas muris TaxID=1796652 RepID=UPI0023F1E221|nr:aminotransferase class I/II-fold pyridoxal phosphate-dependent enzyme [Turicimonas muris]